MNERIKELTEQAEIKFEAHPQHSGIVTAVITPADLEMFAELIVRECMSKTAGYLLENEFGGADDVKEASEELSKHFGIK